MLDLGIARSPDFTLHGESISMIHGTSTNAYGNLSRLRDFDGTFEQNYQRYCKQLGVHQRDHVVISPVKHTANVARIEKRSGWHGLQHVDHDNLQVVDIHVREGIKPPNVNEADFLVGFDGMLTNSPNTFLGLAHADCAPLFLMFPRKNVLGMIHVGILGHLSGIVENAFDSARAWYEVEPYEAVAYIGPCISNIAYNVRKSGMWDPVLSKYMDYKTSLLFDLKVDIRKKLIYLGVPATAILYSRFCTAQSNLFFSNHKTPPEAKEKLGRNLSLIGRVL